MSGNISSPGWPDRYENNGFCRWEFTAPEGMVIKVNNTSSIDIIVLIHQNYIPVSLKKTKQIQLFTVLYCQVGLISERDINTNHYDTLCIFYFQESFS